MAISVPQTALELNSFVSKLDVIILDKAVEWGRRVYKSVIEELDKAIAENKGEELCIEHSREVWYQTCLGAVKIRRRQYHDKGKRYRYLLDDLAGMDRYQHKTNSVRELALEMASFMPYRRSAEVLKKTSAIDLPHQTIWRIVGKTADPYLNKAENELKWFMETGEIPDSESKVVSRLFMEADGVMLSLQRERQRKAEVKLGIAYEGWERVGKDRYRTVNKLAHAAIATGEQEFWAGMTLKLQSTYDLASIKETIVGGDGASWVKDGTGYVNGRFQLDRYHLYRELTMALGRDNETKGMVWHACNCGDVAKGLQIMEELRKCTRGEKAERIAHAYRYLQENSSGLADYRLELGEEGRYLRRTGAMEGNIDKLVVRRMKNQGMSWTIKGIRRLLCVRFLILENELAGYLSKEQATPKKVKLPGKKIRQIVNHLSMEQPDDWLQANIPALRGPHANRSWVLKLKEMSAS